MADERSLGLVALGLALTPALSGALVASLCGAVLSGLVLPLGRAVVGPLVHPLRRAVGHGLPTPLVVAVALSVVAALILAVERRVRRALARQPGRVAYVRPMAQVVAVATGKGGVGKSSIAAAVAGVLAAKKKHIAVVELDPQGDLADDLGCRDDAAHDGGEAVTAAIRTGAPLGPGIQARERLTYYPGGPALEALNRTPGWSGLDSKLGESIAKLKGYDLVLIDTPPSAEALQHVSLAAAQHLLIPTAVDTSSLRALYAIATRLVEVEAVNPDLAFLGVVLWNVPTAASRIRADARQTLNEILGDTVPLLDTTVRSAFATAYECRRRGMLPHELARLQGGNEPFWKALAEGRSPDRVPTSALSLAGDYTRLAKEITDLLEAAR